MRIYEMPIDCGVLGALDARIHIIGTAVTHVYIMVSHGVQVDVVFKLSNRTLSNIRELCKNAESYIETSREA